MVDLRVSRVLRVSPVDTRVRESTVKIDKIHKYDNESHGDTCMQS